MEYHGYWEIQANLSGWQTFRDKAMINDMLCTQTQNYWHIIRNMKSGNQIKGAFGIDIS